jgi:hypothetical protein
MTCMNKTAETNYLRCVSVREALHISASSSLWTSCRCVVKLLVIAIGLIFCLN